MPDLPKVTSPRELLSLFEEYDIQPNKQLGQNFLIDANIVRKIVAAVEAAPGDKIIEVGAGAGALSLALARPGIELTILEVDRGLVRLLRDILPQYPEVTISHKDVLEVNWRQLLGEIPPGSKAKLVSNLPYNISGPFMYNLFKEGFPFERAVLMFQKEVALRLLANPGDSDYGSLSVLCRYYAEGRILFNVSKNVFWPRPKVGSAVILLRPRERTLTPGEEAVFWKLVQGVFRQRRKTILNGLQSTYLCSRDEATSLLNEANIDNFSRPEELSVEQFALLARITYNYHSKN